jgi:hypothetical protein
MRLMHFANSNALGQSGASFHPAGVKSFPQIILILSTQRIRTPRHIPFDCVAIFSYVVDGKEEASEKMIYDKKKKLFFFSRANEICKSDINFIMFCKCKFPLF